MTAGAAAKVSAKHPIAMFLSLFGCLSLVYTTIYGANKLKYGPNSFPKVLANWKIISVTEPNIISSWSIPSSFSSLSSSSSSLS